jgi:peptidoglycan/xylan/chitin deacetylase (PgdA/CDA1 family)
MKSYDLKNGCDRLEQNIEKIKQREDLWNLYTRREEYNSPFTDEYDRFPYYLSSHRNIFEPTISQFLISNNFELEYPENKNFAVCLTHDIDVIYPGIMSSAKAMMERKFSYALKIPFSRVYRKWNPCWNFREIMELESKYDAKSSFYFLALTSEETDFNYNIKDLESELGYISDSGWEVGLHGGHESYKNLEDIKEKKRRIEKVLGKEIIGYRNHFLRFRVPNTWELLSKAGFKYDSTFGYSDCAGFRNGMCHPFRPYNLETGEEIEILEIPLTIMDRTLMESHMKLDLENAWRLTKQLIDIVEKCKGVITILWHNTQMQGKNLKFYENVLKYCSEKNAWITSGEEIYNFWES